MIRSSWPRVLQVLGHVGEAFVAVHDAVALAPVALGLGVQPDHRARPLLDQVHQVEPRVGEVGAAVAQEDHRGVAVDAVEVVLARSPPAPCRSRSAGSRWSAAP